MTKTKKMPTNLNMGPEDQIYLSAHPDGIRINFQNNMMVATFLLRGAQATRIRDFMNEVVEFVTEDDKLETRKKEIQEKNATART